VDEGDAYINRRFILSAFNYVTETNISSIEQEWEVKFTEQQRSLCTKPLRMYTPDRSDRIGKGEKKIYVVLNTEDALAENRRWISPRPLSGKGVPCQVRILRY
jgi:hypothetical protein